MSFLNSDDQWGDLFTVDVYEEQFDNISEYSNIPYEPDLTLINSYKREEYSKPIRDIE